MDLDASLHLLARNPAAPLDLAEVALRLARDEYPHLDVEGYLSELVGMGREAKTYLGGGLEARVAGLSRYLFHEMGFHGNTQHYYDPRNSYFNDVLDLRTGLPITLSLLAMAVGRRAGMEVHGVGLPGHFVALAAAGDETVLFDPFHGGRVLDAEECAQMVEQVTGKPFELTDEHLRPTPAGLVVARMLTNLKGVYLRNEDFPRLIRVTERLCQVAPFDFSQRRDLGAAYLQASQPGKAIDHLQAYLAQAEPGPDADAVRQLLEQANRFVSRWN